MQKSIPGLLSIIFLYSPLELFAQCSEQLKPGGGFAGFQSYVSALYSRDSDGSGPAPPLLYAGGSFDIAGNDFASRIAVWDGDDWAQVGSGLAPLLWVNSILWFNGKLVVAGYGGTYGWDGSNWTSMNNGLSGTLTKLIIYQSALIGAAGGVVRWNGTTWTTLGQGVSGSVHAMCIHNGYLYAGGAIYSAAGSPAQKIAYWTTLNWYGMQTDMDDDVNALLVFNGELIAAGDFIVAGGKTTNHVARFDGTQWHAMGAGLPGTVQDLSVYQGDLIATWYDSTSAVSPDYSFDMIEDDLLVS